MMHSDSTVCNTSPVLRYSCRGPVKENTAVGQLTVKHNDNPTTLSVANKIEFALFHRYVHVTSWRICLSCLQLTSILIPRTGMAILDAPIRSHCPRIASQLPGGRSTFVRPGILPALIADGIHIIPCYPIYRRLLLVTAYIFGVMLGAGTFSGNLGWIPGVSGQTSSMSDRSNTTVGSPCKTVVRAVLKRFYVMADCIPSGRP
ncbi:hypothetical protein EV401DRAFT_1974494 [Pisolithus croceorrhizus]|nr:hypothetical protein EV401DRAFT_1974494 [Pisolithus croceorrhizus]